MNSVQVAQTVWNNLCRDRYCPTDEEIPTLVDAEITDEPEWVATNAVRRVKIRVDRLKNLIANEDPDGPEYATYVKQLQTEPIPEG